MGNSFKVATEITLSLLLIVCINLNVIHKLFISQNECCCKDRYLIIAHIDGLKHEIRTKFCCHQAAHLEEILLLFSS